ncbi:MAG: hypothetical protein ACT4PE_07130 [Candidatus Eiseniibacteriota bacterium]
MDEKYEVFGRRREDAALTRIGVVTIAAGARVEAEVERQHGGDWLELVAIPASAIGWAIEENRA